MSDECVNVIEVFNVDFKVDYTRINRSVYEFTPHPTLRARAFDNVLKKEPFPVLGQ